MKILIAVDQKLALVRAAALGACAVNKIACINRQPIGCRILMSLYKGSPPGHPTFFLLSTTGGDVTPDIAAKHDLQLAFGRCRRAPGQDVAAKQSGYQGSHQNRQFSHVSSVTIGRMKWRVKNSRVDTLLVNSRDSLEVPVKLTFLLSFVNNSALRTHCTAGPIGFFENNFLVSKSSCRNGTCPEHGQLVRFINP